MRAYFLSAFARSAFMVVALAGGLSACGSSDSGTGDGSTSGLDGGGGDAVVVGDDASTTDAGTAAGTYKYLAIVDQEKTPDCTGTGPGSDIDAIDLIRGGSTIGVGLKGSAMLVAATSGVTPCTTCGSSMGACTHSGMDQAANAEGIQDAHVYANMPDTGYISLNTATLWLQVGQANGNAPEQDIMSGDQVHVYEVDLSNIADGSAYAGCTCTPEKYVVYAYVDPQDPSTRVQLTPSSFATENAGVCGNAPTDSIGCGSTTFTVP